MRKTDRHVKFIEQVVEDGTIDICELANFYANNNTGVEIESPDDIEDMVNGMDIEAVLEAVEKIYSIKVDLNKIYEKIQLVEVKELAGTDYLIVVSK